jgi:MGT family glycosyltransferase
MKRYLFVVPPLTGHVNPTVSLGQSLKVRGHTVAWVGHAGAVRKLLPPDAQLFALDEAPIEEHYASVRSRAEAARGLAAFKQLWEDFFVPLARWMRPGVEAAVDEFKPDLLIVDQQALAGSLVARRRNLPWITTATTSARLADSLADLPKVKAWVEAQWVGLEREADLEPRPEPDLSPMRVIVFSSEALAGPGRFPPQTRFVGPALEGRADATPFPFDALASGTHLLVSLGTVNAERGALFYRVLREALAEEPLQAIVVASPELLEPAPKNFLVRQRIPQLAVLPHVQAVLCHGGHNTVCESLAHGLPLVVMPIRDDQPVIAEQVVHAGVGLRLRFGRTRPDELRDAVRRVLKEPAFREAAAGIQKSFKDAGGTRAATDIVEAVS